MQPTCAVGGRGAVVGMPAQGRCTVLHLHVDQSHPPPASTSVNESSLTKFLLNEASSLIKFESFYVCFF
jgi:hypothetical protein